MNRSKFLALCSAALALSVNQLSAQEAITTLSVDAGYHHGETKRTIDLQAVNSANVALTGPIKHDTNYNVWDVQLGSRTLIDQAYYLKANLSYGHVYKAKDTMDCRSVLYGGLAPTGSAVDVLGRRRETRKRHGSTFNALAGVGYLIPLNDSVSFIPTVGYEHQEMTVKKYMQESTVASANVKQKERWMGAFIGLEIPINFDCGLKVIPNVQYTFAKYKASYSNQPKGLDGRYYYRGSKRGHILKAGIEAFMPLNDQWSFDAGYSFQRKSAKPKLNTSFIGDTTATTTQYHGKNNKAKVKTDEHSVNVGFTYLF